MAHLVQQGDRAQYIDAIKFASTEWGGYAHPVIPISREGRIPPLYRQIINEIGPDAIAVHGDIDMSLAQRLAAPLGADIYRRPALDHWSPGMHPLGLVPAGGLAARTLLIPENTDRLLDLTALGGIWPGQEADWAATGVKVVPASRAIDLLDGQLDVPSPIALTRREVGFITHSSWAGGPVLVYTGPSTLGRSYWFWNLRALTLYDAWPTATKLLWLPRSALSDSSVWGRLREVCLRSATDPDLVLVGKNRERLRALAIEAGFQENVGTQVTTQLASAGASRDLEARPLRFRLNIRPAVFLMGARTYGKPVRTPVTVTRPRTTISADSPIAFSSRAGYVRLEIDGIDELRWPKRPSVAHLIDPNASYKRAGVSLLVSPSANFTATLSIPEASSVLSALLAANDWSWSISDKGRYSEALTSAVRERLPLLASDPAMRIARSLMRDRPGGLRTSGTLDDGDEPRELAAADNRRWQTLKQVASHVRLGLKTLQPLVADLIGAGLLHRGFRFRCPSCSLRADVPLRRVDDRIECDGCRAVSPLAGLGGAEPSLVYSLNPLLDRVLSQGCLGHVLAAQWVAARLQAVLVVPGALLKNADGTVREVDLLALSHDELIVGEVKETKARFSVRVVANSRKLASSLGANRLVLASTDTWERRDQEQTANRARTKAMSVTALGGLEIRDSSLNPVEVNAASPEA